MARTDVVVPGEHRPTGEKNLKQRLKIGVLSRFSLDVVELGW